MKQLVLKKHWPLDELPFVMVEGCSFKPLDNVKFVKTPYEYWTKNPDGGWDVWVAVKHKETHDK